VVGSILVTTLVIHLAFWIQGHNALGEDISGMGLLRCVAQFFIGMLLCILYQRTRDTAAAPQLAILLSISAVVIASGVVAGGWPETLMLPLLWVCVILSLALWTVRNPLSWRPLVIIGDWSYATYLSHILLWRLFKLVFVDEGRPTPLPILFGFFLVVLVASALLYRWFELPAQQWVRSLASISRSRRST
jgi:peptidoglycan/LPS O-acetylase OafA/YrhL